jgi:hypothetical protein
VHPHTDLIAPRGTIPSIAGIGIVQYKPQVVSAAAAFLGLTVSELRSQLYNGVSLQRLARERHRSVRRLRRMLNQLQAHIGPLAF